MILVKSLVVLFLILISSQLYTYFFSNPDEKEGFTGEIEQEEQEEQEEQVEELTPFTTATPLENHKQSAIDPQLMSDLKEKMSELLQLSDKATDINNKLENMN